DDTNTGSPGVFIDTTGIGFGDFHDGNARSSIYQYSAFDHLSISGPTNGVQIVTPSGTGLFGARNSSWFHFETDRPSFYFYQPVTFRNTIDLNNSNILNVNRLEFTDPGGSEGIKWNGGYEWEIVEAPDNEGNASGPPEF